MMKTRFAIAAVLAVVLLLGGQSPALSQSSDNRVTIHGMFGDRVLGDTFKPRPSKFGGSIKRGPSGNFLGLDLEAPSRMFKPASATRYSVSLIPPARLPGPAAEPRALPELRPRQPLPLPRSLQPTETVPSESPPSGPDVWMRGPTALPTGQPTDPAPAPGRGAGYALPLSNQYAVGFDRDIPRPIHQVSQGSRAASNIADRLRMSLAGRARSPISVSLVDGTATIHGQVATEHDRRLITYLVMFEPGVRRVNNQVSIGGPSLLSGGPER